MEQKDKSPWLTPEEAATYLRLFDKDGNPNVSYLYKQTCARLIKTYKLGKFNRYRREDLDALLTKGA
ncbi:helix-turn-helix domain-containing protein [bacterium]|nr:helix-turn-helix domain-containing protein [bacterium]